MSYRGRLVVEHIARGEREVEYWLRFPDRLTPEEKRRITAGDYASIVRPLKPEWVAGEWLKVGNNLHIKPEPAMWRREKYRIPFSVRDFRERLVRRVPPTTTFTRNLKAASDQSTPETIEESHYTSSAKLAVAECGGAISVEFQEHLTRRANDQWNALHHRKNIKQELNRLTREIRNKTLEAERRGFDATLQIRALEEQLANLQRDLDEDAA